MPKWRILTPVFAAITISISNVPGEVDYLQEFTADIILDCTSCNTSYLRGVFFYPDSSHTYSGFTQNNSGDWISTSGDKTAYYKIEEGSWSGQLKFKFDSQKTPGPYYFKVGRYTSADSSADWSNQSDLQVSGPSPTPLPTPSPAPTLSPTSSPTSKPNPTATKTPTLTPSPKPSSTPIPKPSPTLTPTPTLIPLEEEILGIQAPQITLSTPGPTPTPSLNSSSNPSSIPWLSYLFIGSGLILFSFSLIIYLRSDHS